MLFSTFSRQVFGLENNQNYINHILRLLQLFFYHWLWGAHHFGTCESLGSSPVNMESHNCLMWLFIIILCGFFIMCCSRFIMFRSFFVMSCNAVLTWCVFIMTLCNNFIMWCGFIMMCWGCYVILNVLLSWCNVVTLLCGLVSSLCGLIITLCGFVIMSS